MIARIFPRRTKLTPIDNDVFIGYPDLLTPYYDQVDISVTFSYDRQKAEQMAVMWERYADKVCIGGVAYGDRGDTFIAGQYLKFGAVITSRGCPNNSCWFCDVPDREGDIRELPIVEGWNLLDSNILACSDEHISSVFGMLEYSKHKYHQSIELTGGLEAKRLQDWHVNWLKILHPKQLFFAYDTEDDYDPLFFAGKMLDKAEIPFNSRRCYVLCGFNGDTKGKAENRMLRTIEVGFIPMAMVYRNNFGLYDYTWSKFQKYWTRPAIMRAEGLLRRNKCLR